VVMVQLILCFVCASVCDIGGLWLMSKQIDVFSNVRVPRVGPGAVSKSVRV